MRISDWSSDVCSSDLCPFGCSDALRDELCPRPAQAEQGLRGCPRSFAFWPAGRLKRGEERFGCGMIERGNVGFGQFTISDEEIKRTRESLGRRHDKPRRMHEGPQLQQIESRQVRDRKSTRLNSSH